MKKLRFKNRNGVLYFGIDGKFKSSKLKYTNINKNIVISKFKDGRLDNELGIGSSENVQTIEELLSEVLDSKSKVLRTRTITTYRMTSKNWIIPYFKDILVSNVKPIDIKNFQDSFIDKGLGNGSTNIARILLKEVFALALLKEMVTINPVIMVKLPRDKKKKKKQLPFSLDEIDIILDCEDTELRNFLGISLFTGMRSGELLALKWSDVDLDTDTVSISKTISCGSINEAKTESSIRDIEILAQAKKYFKAQQLESGLNNEYVFVPKRGVYHATNQYFYKKYKDLISKLNLADRSLHNTRHTFASMMLNNGIEVLWVSHMLGHNNIQMTLKIYTHYMPKKEKMKLAFLEKRYKNGTKG